MGRQHITTSDNAELCSSQEHEHRGRDPRLPAPVPKNNKLSALLPLKLSGRHYGDNLSRVDLLFSSLLHFGGQRVLDELLVVARGDEADLIDQHLTQWPELPLRLVIEDDYFPAFREFRRPWQVRPWQRQQIIKLNASAFTSTAIRAGAAALTTPHNASAWSTVWRQRDRRRGAWNVRRVPRRRQVLRDKAFSSNQASSGELRALRWTDVDLAGNVPRIERSWDAKGGMIEPKSFAGRRKVPIAAVLRPVLRHYLIGDRLDSRDGLVFGRTDGTPFARQAKLYVQ